MNYKRTLVNFYEDIVLVTHLCIFKIQIHAFKTGHLFSSLRFDQMPEYTYCACVLLIHKGYLVVEKLLSNIVNKSLCYT